MRHGEGQLVGQPMEYARAGVLQVMLDSPAAPKAPAYHPLREYCPVRGAEKGCGIAIMHHFGRKQQSFGLGKALHQARYQLPAIIAQPGLIAEKTLGVECNAQFFHLPIFGVSALLMSQNVGNMQYFQREALPLYIALKIHQA